MELKEFIINTVSYILDAVNELQEENKTNAVINAGRGIGVMLNGIGVKLGNDRSNSNNAITSIKFVIPYIVTYEKLGNFPVFI